MKACDLNHCVSLHISSAKETIALFILVCKFTSIVEKIELTPLSPPEKKISKCWMIKIMAHVKKTQ